MSGSGLSLSQEKALAIVPKVSSCISIPCSCFIIYEVIYDYRHRRGGTTAIQRVLVGMSLVDILASSAWFMSTWAVPAESGWYLASGNRTTCNYQGFLLQLAIGAPLYNSSLALFYLLMIKMRWSDEKLARIEKFVHGLILSFTWGTSILLLKLNQYNHIGAVCWVIGEPAECGNSSFQANPDIPCDRGDYAWAWGLALFYGPLWVCVIACSTSMVILYLEVRKTHAKSRRHSSVIKGMRHSQNKSGRDTSKVAVQAILFSLTFLITWMPSTLWSIAHWFNWKHYGLDIAAATAEPLQGLWNFLIFLKSRPRTVIKIRRFLSRYLPCCVSPLPSQHFSSYHSESRDDINNSRVSFVTGLRKKFMSMKSSTYLSGELSLAGHDNHETTSTPFGQLGESQYDDKGEENEGIIRRYLAAEMVDISSSSSGSEGVASFLEDENDENNNKAEEEEEQKDANYKRSGNALTGFDDSITSRASDKLFAMEPQHSGGRDDDSTNNEDETGSNKMDNISSVPRDQSDEIDSENNNDNSNAESHSGRQPLIRMLSPPDHKGSNDYNRLASDVTKDRNSNCTATIDTDSGSSTDQSNPAITPAYERRSSTLSRSNVMLFDGEMSAKDKEYFYFT